MFAKSISLLLTVCIFSNCSGEKTYSAKTVSGTKYVENLTSSRGNHFEIELQFVQKIGDLENADNNYLLFRPSDVAVDASGNIYVLDQGNFRIQKYSAHGQYLATLGTQGQGPGEFERPEYIQIESDILYIFDRSKDSYQAFNLEGKYIKSFKVRDDADYLAIDLERVVTMPRLFYSANTKDLKTAPLFKVYGRDGDPVHEFGERRIYDDMSSMSQGNFFNYTRDSLGNIFIAYYMQNRIEKYAPNGQLLLQITRDLGFGESKAIEPIEFQGGLYAGANYFSRAIAVDGLDRIWTIAHWRQASIEEKAKRKTKENIFLFEVFDSNGILLGTIKNPQIKPTNYFRDRGGFRIFGDRLFLSDATEEMAVYEYKIVTN